LGTPFQSPPARTAAGILLAPSEKSGRSSLCASNEKGNVEVIMKPMALVGILLIVVGIMALVYQGITYTTRKSVVDIGPIHATADKETTIPLPPIVGGAATVAGLALLVMSGKR
jgi:hypothetical protein